ncbi:hypothetical protein, partial [Streptomyces sp. NPDC004285]
MSTARTTLVYSLFLEDGVGLPVGEDEDGRGAVELQEAHLVVLPLGAAVSGGGRTVDPTRLPGAG